MRLGEVLREWHVNTPLPPRFPDQVWQRISRTEAKAKTPPLAAFARLLEVVLPQPRVAFSFVAALCVLGVAAGSIAAQFQTSRLNATLGERYVQSVDPYHSATTHQ